MGSPPPSVQANSVAEVVELLEQWGRHRYDEDVTQLDHALQTAALARAANADDELVAAALLHDVGHLLELRDSARVGSDTNPASSPDHARRGARWLAALFPDTVTDPISLHVAAKRYLCAVDPSYGDALSIGSTASLARQGGPMGERESTRFASRPGSVPAMQLRRWDDCGKVDDSRSDGLNTYLQLLARVVR